MKIEPKKIIGSVYWAGAVDWDRRLFDSLIPIPDGTSYNGYIVKGSQKTALIDTVDPAKADILLQQLEGTDEIHYIVSQHSEQDHSGALPLVLEKYRDARVIASPKGKEFLISHLRIPEQRIATVSDNETLSLGDKTFEFIHAPWVHWPETMLTYLREDKMLFTCDLFGSHLASSDPCFHDEAKVCDASKRYYAEVMMPFRKNIQKHLERLAAYAIASIAPGHGPVHMEPECIMNSHRKWISDEVSNTVVIAYATMHGSTEALVERLTGALYKRGVKVERFNLAVTDTGKLAMALVDAATIVVGSPTVLTGAHPLAASAAFLANALRPKLKFASIIGSFGWGGRMVEQISAIIKDLKTEVLEPVVVKGLPTENDYLAIDRLADSILKKHVEAGIV
ncbi:MAG: FprA family A-type flavoprotein [Deltaproteobacteria bacterium]|nr:FprA family A-type flavoprotein [Deltaproteobacteria bacterium]